MNKMKKKEALILHFSWLQVKIVKLLMRFLPITPVVSTLDDKVRRVLIYGAMGIGNMIMYTPTLRAIRNHYPEAFITLLIDQYEQGCIEVVNGCNLVDETMLIKRQIIPFIKIAKKIRRRRYDLLISNFHGNKLFLARLTALSGIPLRVGHITGPDWSNPFDSLYNIQVPMLPDIHEVDRGLLLAEKIGCKIVNKTPCFNVDNASRLFADKFWKKEEFCGKDIILGVQVGTSSIQSWKQWDIVKLAHVCDRLIDKMGIKLVMLGAPNDHEILNRLLTAMISKPSIALGKTSVAQAAAIIEKCNALLCSDSGLMHISDAIGTPVIAIWGPTDYKRTRPYGKGHMIIRKKLSCSPCFTLHQVFSAAKVANCTHRHCLDLISEDDVMATVKRMLKGTTVYSSNTGV